MADSAFTLGQLELPLPVNKGGTGASDPTGARNNLGLGGSLMRRVALPVLNLPGIIPNNGQTIDIPSGTKMFDVLSNNVQMSTGNWGFRMADASGIAVIGYKQGHASFVTAGNSVSSAGTWIPYGNHDNPNQDFYGTARFFLVDEPSNLWGCAGDIWQVSSIGGETRMYRPMGGTVQLNSPIEQLEIWGAGTSSFISGTVSVVAWVEV